MLEVSPKKNKLAEVYYYFLKRVLKKCHIIETLLTYHKVLTIKQQGKDKASRLALYISLAPEDTDYKITETTQSSANCVRKTDLMTYSILNRPTSK